MNRRLHKRRRLLVWSAPVAVVVVIAILKLSSVVIAGGLAVSTLFVTQLALLGAVLVVPGIALGALLASLYLLVGQLAPRGSGTRTFAWLVTVNNGGLAVGAAAAGAWSEASGPVAGLWLAAACALAGIGPALGALILSARIPHGTPASPTR